MPDFETMPIGTRAAMRETAELLRSYEQHHRDIAARTGAKTGREEKAKRNADAAAKLEALLVLPVERQPRIPDEVREMIRTKPMDIHNSGSGVPCDYGTGSDEFPSTPPPLCGL